MDALLIIAIVVLGLVLIAGVVVIYNCIRFNDFYNKKKEDYEFKNNNPQ